MSTREEQFQKWFNGPEVRKIAARDYGNELGATQKMLEDYLRSAFEGGFQTCLDEVRGRLKGMGTTAPKSRKVAAAASANPSPRKKPL